MGRSSILYIAYGVDVTSYVQKKVDDDDGSNTILFKDLIWDRENSPYLDTYYQDNYPNMEILTDESSTYNGRFILVLGNSYRIDLCTESPSLCDIEIGELSDQLQDVLSHLDSNDKNLKWHILYTYY